MMCIDDSVLICNQSKKTDALWLSSSQVQRSAMRPMLLYQLAADPAMGVVKLARVIAGRRLARTVACLRCNRKYCPTASPVPSASCAENDRVPRTW